MFRTALVLGVAEVQVAAGSDRVVAGADWLLDALDVLTHRVDAAVHAEQLVGNLAAHLRAVGSEVKC